MKDTLLFVGVLAGMLLTAIGALLFYGGNGDTPNAVALARLFSFIFLIPGILLLVFCGWEFFR